MNQRLASNVDQTAALLREQGYCIVPDVLPRSKIAALDSDLSDAFATTPFGTGGFYGETTKRFGRLLARSPHADALVEHPLILAVVEAILAPFCDRVQLNVAPAIAVYPQAPAQLPHRDQDLVQAIRESTQQNVSRAGDQLTSRNLQIQPSITIRPGAPVRLVVHRDLVLAPWNDQG